MKLKGDVRNFLTDCSNLVRIVKYQYRIGDISKRSAQEAIQGIRDVANPYLTGLYPYYVNRRSQRYLEEINSYVRNFYKVEFSNYDN
jgi:hypothetical protein